MKKNILNIQRFRFDKSFFYPAFWVGPAKNTTKRENSPQRYDFFASSVTLLKALGTVPINESRLLTPRPEKSGFLNNSKHSAYHQIVTFCDFLGNFLSKTRKFFKSLQFFWKYYRNDSVVGTVLVHRQIRNTLWNILKCMKDFLLFV